jgi:hypothetical protein
MKREPRFRTTLSLVIEREFVTRKGMPLEPGTTGLVSASVPDCLGAVRAWRLWEVGYVDAVPRLRSLFRIRFWPTGAPFEARCELHKLRLPRRAGHAAPVDTCSCGIYAVSFEFMLKLADQDRLLPPGRSLAIGTVSLWGDVVECERGWRAALAYPSRLFVPLVCSGAEETAAGLRDYGVPVEPLQVRNITDALAAVAEVAA